jgi:hypothetical protein
MPINPAIALGVKGIELQDPLTQYGRVAAIQQARQQNALAQMQMQQAEREIEERNRLREFMPGMTAQNRNQLLGYGAAGRQVYESLLKGEKESREGEKAASDVAAARMKQSRDLLPSVNSPESYANWRNYTLQNLPGLVNVIPEQYSPEVARNLMLEADKALEQHFVSQNLGGATRVVAMPKFGQGPARTVEGTEARMTMAPGEAERIKLEGQRLGLEGRRVAVMEENARRDADPSFQQRMGAARATGEAMAKGDVQAIQALPKVLSRAEEGIRLIDELIGKRDSKGRLIEGSKPHPGFENTVGATWLPGARLVPGTDAAGFMARFDQIKGASFLEAFEALKGGGAITEKEGGKGTDAINRMSIATDEKEFIRAAMDLQDVVRKGVENAQKRAARAGSAAPAAPTSGGVIDFGSLR